MAPPLLSAPVPVSHMQSPSERKPNTGQSVLETREGTGGEREGSDHCLPPVHRFSPMAGSTDISTSSPAPGPVGGTLRTTMTAPEDSRAQGELTGCSVATDMF